MKTVVKDYLETLAKVQAELKAPKNQYNSFGKYKYRSCEDILEALKPILKEQGAMLTLEDELINLGNRYYVKATCFFSCPDGAVAVSAYAREEENKKGMDGSQITGAASSYARKYALNGLFLIDDNQDSDSTNTHGQEQKTEPAKPKPHTPDYKKDLEVALKKAQVSDMKEWIEAKGYSVPISQEQAKEILDTIDYLYNVDKPIDGDKE